MKSGDEKKDQIKRGGGWMGEGRYGGIDEEGEYLKGIK